ncbi:MAG: AAA family ATPase [Pseudomonadota bacterium]
MVTSEHYYEILDYSKRKLREVEPFASHREQLLQPDFMSADHSCLIGEKGVGKTVLACQRALMVCGGHHEKILYMSLDDTLFAGDTMYQLAKMGQDRGVELIIFDEVHRYPNWKVDLKSIADRLTVKTITSGSSILSFSNLGGLSRRMVKYQLFGLSFREFLRMHYGVAHAGLKLTEIIHPERSALREIMSAVTKSTGKTVALLFDEYLRRGYYAYSLKFSNLKDFLQTLRQSTEDTIAYEIVVAQTHSRPDMARKLQSLFKAIAQSVPYSVDYEALKQVAQIADLRTLKHYLSCLQKAGIICSVDRKSLKNLRKPEKLYLGNTCLYFAYADIHPNMGSLRETAFLTAMRLADIDVLVHSRQADFSVGTLGFEIGGPNKSKEQIRGESQSFIVKDESDLSEDPRVLPLWIFGFLVG